MREVAGYSVEKVLLVPSHSPICRPPPVCYVGCISVLPCVVACEWAVQKGRWAFPPLASHTPTVAPPAQPGGDSVDMVVELWLQVFLAVCKRRTEHKVDIITIVTHSQFSLAMLGQRYSNVSLLNPWKWITTSKTFSNSERLEKGIGLLACASLFPYGSLWMVEVGSRWIMFTPHFLMFVDKEQEDVED